MGQVSALIDEIVTVENVFRELFDGGAEHAQAVAHSLEQLADVRQTT